MASPANKFLQPRPDPFEGVLRHVFDKAGVSRSMAHATTPSSLFGTKYAQIDEALQAQMPRAMEKCTHVLA